MASVTLLSIACYALGDLIDYRVVALLLLVAVSVLAVLFDILPVLVSALLSAILLNIFFIEPVPHYEITDAESVLLFLVYLFIASVNAVLTNRLRNQEKKIRDREEKENTIKLYNTLLNSLSHELKTPIATIIGSIDTLKETDNTIQPIQRMELLSEMEIASTRLNSQVENLLNMSRLETGTLKLKKDWCDVNELVFLVINELSLNDTHELVFEPDETLPLFKLDSGLMETVLSNIIHNATRYTPKNSTIHVTTAYDDTHLWVHICDNGNGIPEPQINRIFEKFYRLPNSGTGGSGLGLSIAKGFVEAHGGTVQVINQTDGGAAFTIMIPAETSYLKNVGDDE
ncbi:sensor histidine kinase [Parapedobacter sp. 10938]|uniref:sensor histidine kinase n=1 Tax=Parapedobacter flavus TaxID=3110225 RepID=UPI002DB62245|nr:ATP-binding protein [Parapedobacter sp. 10938]MEC3879205.1 ATP-binding protein [Parapedobacter sp. 10938]